MAKPRSIPAAAALKFGMLSLGSIIAAVGLEIFLIPNRIIDGGVIGIAIMASHLAQLPLSLFIVLLNLPFLYLGYNHIGRSFTVATLFSVLSLAFWVSFFHPVPSLTNDLFLAAVFGGIIVGLGVGLIIDRKSVV